MTRLDMAKCIFDCEVRRDKKGHIAVYNLPENDGGGRYEIAGINERYDPKKLSELLQMIKNGEYSQAEKEAIEYIADMTDEVSKWTSKAAIEYFLRDTAFNRGITGCAKILQMACGCVADGIVGPKTRAAIAVKEMDLKGFLKSLVRCRESYEILKVGYRKNLWVGLTGRWDSVYRKAISQVI